MVEIYRNKAQLSAPQARPVSLIISFYKNLRMLELVLGSLKLQTYKNFQLVICDDGSPKEIVDRVHELLEALEIPSIHLWHEDIGFRKNRILNWGLHYTLAEYLVFIDQDCVLHSEFMAEHVLAKSENSVVCGRRINLTKWVSALLTPHKITKNFLEKNILWIAISGLFMKDNNGIKGIYIKNLALRRLFNKKPRGIVGCNFSVFRKSLLDINGFDTRYEGAGFGEDSDIEFRLRLAGLNMLPACNTVVQYHIYHKLLDRSANNEVLFNSIIQEKKVRTNFGYSQQISHQV